MTPNARPRRPSQNATANPPQTRANNPPTFNPAAAAPVDEATVAVAELIPIELVIDPSVIVVDDEAISVVGIGSVATLNVVFAVTIAMPIVPTVVPGISVGVDDVVPLVGINDVLLAAMLVVLDIIVSMLVGVALLLLA